MKIAVAGSHGTGKSSFAKGLAKKLKAQYIPDIVTAEGEIGPQGFTINENTPFEVQLLLVMRQWQLEQITPEPWVADKCLFDYLVYMRDDFDEDIKSTVRKVVKGSGYYDYIFYLPIEFPMELDEWRSSDLGFQREIGLRYKKLLDEWGIKYITLPSYIKESSSPKEAIQKRINHALSYIEK